MKAQAQSQEKKGRHALVVDRFIYINALVWVAGGLAIILNLAGVL